MDIGTVLIIILAILFFGGIGFVSYVSRRQQSSKPDRAPLNKK